MKRKLATLIAALALSSFALSGCLVRSADHGSSKHESKKPKKSKKCHPSQHWDGHKCKHNGKGKGSRKHDG